MLRIHFSSRDLSRTTIAAAPDPLWEVLLSLHVLRAGSGDPALDGWRHRVRRSIRDPTTQLLASSAVAIAPPGSGLDGLDGLDGHDGLHGLHGLGRLGGVLAGYCRTALAPHWSSISTCVAADRGRRVHQLANGGIDELLSNLHPQVSWKPPVLEVPQAVPADVSLGGRGLRLQPSFFCDPAPARPRDTDATPTLVYPVRRPADALSAPPTRRGQSLAALLGRTRAAALAAVRRGCTTSELARRCGVSAATASQQATVLRGAGLISTRRDGGSVRHELTDLGSRLLAQQSTTNLDLDDFLRRRLFV